MSIDPPINNNLGSDVTELQCSFKSNCSQTKKRRKNKKRLQIEQNSQIDFQREGSSIKDDSVGINSHNECRVDINTKTDLQTIEKLSRSQKKRMRKKQKRNETVISTKAHVPSAECHLLKVGGNAEKQSDSSRNPSTDLKRKRDIDGKSGLIESVVDCNRQTASLSELSRSQKRRMRKKQKLNETVISNEAHGPLAELHLIKEGENAEKQSDSSKNPNTDLKRKHDNDIKPDLIDSVLDCNNKTASLSELSRSQKKRMRKKRKLNETVISNKAQAPVSELHVIKVGENSEKQSDSSSNPSADLKRKHDNDGKHGLSESVVACNIKTTSLSKLSRSQKKKMRKKQRLNETVISNKADGPLAELQLLKVGENAEKQGDSPRNPSTDLKKEHDNDGKPGLIEPIVDINRKTAPLLELSRSKKKRMRKKQKINATVDKAYGPLAELELINVGRNALIPDNQNDSPRSPSATLVKKHDNNDGTGLGLVEKKNIKMYKMKGELRTYQRKKRQFSDYEENAEHVVLAKEHAASVKVVKNVLTDKTSCDCSNGDFACAEGKNINETEKYVNLNVPVKQGYLPKVSFSSLERPLVECPDKKLLILDINGILADIVSCCSTISRKSVFKRPFFDDFMQFCFDKFNVGVWSSRSKKNVNLALNFLMRGSRHKLLFCWHRSHCTKTGFTTIESKSKPLVLKELKKLWDKLEPGLPWKKGEYNESNTLLLDDSPYKALRNPAHTAVFPHPYQNKDTGDSSLGPGGDIRVYLEQLAEAPNVQEYVAQNPFGQQAITESDPSWDFYQKILNGT
ncbi:hypothetical protein MANES_14G086700v8 [Manihot esculenta]|uniref:Uncharacterized protein n=2 Tax=Manihot esculenta TaxID=3983 RepID=A0ACB7GF72_MANES|nr:hypothetical protein MANES_14G086700v8 [Manihot esculenta]